ncbi:hypothetical protein ACWDRS_31265, partial [Streptomyces griseus]
MTATTTTPITPPGHRHAERGEQNFLNSRAPHTGNPGQQPLRHLGRNFHRHRTRSARDIHH